MATRLYPRTMDDAVLERLAGVPEGTAAALAAQSAAALPDDPRDREGWMAFYDAMTADLDAFDNFRLFGWGQLTRGARAIALTKDGPKSGTIDGQDVEAVGALLRAQGVELPAGVAIADLAGVCWS